MTVQREGAGAIVGGKYRLESKIGEGGMATVWRAVHMTLGRAVAVKFVHAIGPNPQKAADRFLREARAAAAVRHRNIVDIIDFGATADGRPYIVMEALEGETLAQRYDRTTASLGVAEVVRMGAQVLSGLAAVHEAGLVHRDLKPENIFLVRDADGEYPKLLDFGLSRVVGDENESLKSVLPTHENVIAGTPHYMSPEQARGLRDIDHRSDLWSMGIIFYEALAGQLPFDSENPGDLIVLITTTDAPKLADTRPDLGPISDFIARALARKREDRFQSARAMRQALLESAGATAAALVRAGGAGSRDLLRAVGEAYEPGDSGVVPAVELAEEVSGRYRAVAPTLAAEADTFPPPAIEEVPVARPRSRKGVAIGLAVLALAAGTAGGYAVWGRADPAGPPPAAAEVAPPVVVTLDPLPPGAVVHVDGVLRAGPRVELPRGDRAHVIEVTAEGMEPWRTTHRATADATYAVTLTPRAVAEPAPAAEEGAAERPRNGRAARRRAGRRASGTSDSSSTGSVFRDPGF